MVTSVTRFVASVVLFVPLSLVLADQQPAAKSPGPQKNRTLWIGVSCYPASETLRSQLGIPSGRGIVVRNVVEESPAAKAGIERNDLLLEANRQPLSRTRDLVRIVMQSDQQPITIQLLRRGQPHSIKVTAIPRSNRVARTTAKPGTDQQLLPESIEQILPRNRAKPRDNRDLPLRRQRPGALFGGGNLIANLPDNFRITIDRAAGRPPKFILEKDGEKWEVDANNLGELSGSLLPMVEQLLGPDTIPKPPIDLPAAGVPTVEGPTVELPTVEGFDVELPAVELPTVEGSDVELPTKPEDASRGTDKPAEPKSPRPTDESADDS